MIMSIIILIMLVLMFYKLILNTHFTHVSNIDIKTTQGNVLFFGMFLLFVFFIYVSGYEKYETKEQKEVNEYIVDNKEGISLIMDYKLFMFIKKEKETFKYINNPIPKILEDQFYYILKDVRYYNLEKNMYEDNNSITKEEEEYLFKNGIFSKNTNFDLYTEEELKEIYIILKSGMDFNELNEFKKEVWKATNIKDIKNYLEMLKVK